MPHQFQNTIVVQPQHLDYLNHVNNVVYVQLMQNIAVEHWNSIVPHGLNDEIVWVVKRHEIDYHSPAFLNDGLLIKTRTGIDCTGVTWTGIMKFSVSATIEKSSLPEVGGFFSTKKPGAQERLMMQLRRYLINFFIALLVSVT